MPSTDYAWQSMSLNEIHNRWKYKRCMEDIMLRGLKNKLRENKYKFGNIVCVSGPLVLDHLEVFRDQLTTSPNTKCTILENDPIRFNEINQDVAKSEFKERVTVKQADALKPDTYKQLHNITLLDLDLTQAYSPEFVARFISLASYLINTKKMSRGFEIRLTASCRNSVQFNTVKQILGWDTVQKLWPGCISQYQHYNHRTPMGVFRISGGRLWNFPVLPKDICYSRKTKRGE